MTTSQKPTETKQLRENFHPSFEKGTFDLKVPTSDPSMARRLKEVRGGEASKAEAKEKALVASQFKILDNAKPLLYLWGSASAASDPLLISAAESALQLWGHAFHSIPTQRRENVRTRRIPVSRLCWRNRAGSRQRIVVSSSAAPFSVAWSEMHPMTRS
jgi:hypothetical protein